jgi:hypothetical protein
MAIYRSKDERKSLFGHDYLQRAQRLPIPRKYELPRNQIDPRIYDDTTSHNHSNLRNWDTKYPNSAGPTGNEGKSIVFKKYLIDQQTRVGPTTRWTADVNSAVYERKLLLPSANEQPYSHFNRRQALVSMLVQNMKPSTDVYSQPITSEKYSESHRQ